MVPQIRLTPFQFADFQTIRDSSVETLQIVVDALSQDVPVPFHPSHLKEAIARKLPDQQPLIEVLLRQLLSLHGVMREVDLDVESVIAGLRRALQTGEKGWTGAEWQAWLDRESIFKALLELEVVAGTAKALDLSYEHAQLLQKARILTDIRPVFDKGADQIKGAVITHTLRLRYDDIEGEHLMMLALDERDIRSLVSECQRALTKAETIRVTLAEKVQIHALIAGSDETNSN